MLKKCGIVLVGLTHALFTFATGDTIKESYSFSGGFSVSDNGQIQKRVIDDFYNRYWNFMVSTNSGNIATWGNEIGNEKTPWRSYINWNARLQFNLHKKEISLGAHVAYQRYYEAFQQISRDSFASSIEQKIVRVSLFVQKNYSVKKLTFSPGLEIPYFFIGKHVETSRDAFWSPQSPGPPHREDALITTPKGFVTGLNGTASIQYSVLKWLSVYSHVSFGLLYAQCGGDVSREYNTYDYSTAQHSQTYYFTDPPRRMKRWFFSGVQVGLGVMITI